MSRTITSAKENTLALNLAVIFGPLPAPGRTGENAALVRFVSSQDAGPLGKVNPANAAVPVAESSWSMPRPEPRAGPKSPSKSRFPPAPLNEVEHAVGHGMIDAVK